MHKDFVECSSCENRGSNCPYDQFYPFEDTFIPYPCFYFKTRANSTTKQSVKMTKSGCILYARKCKNCEKEFYSQFLHFSSLCKKMFKKERQTSI